MARERRKFQVGRSENRKLHRGHFTLLELPTLKPWGVA